MLYGSGLEHQMRSLTISPEPFDKIENRSELSLKSDRKISENRNSALDMYNPITNPIQINYKNPNVLRMLAQYNN